MFICLDCGCIFEEPTKYIDTHGLDYPPYEEYSGCPSCGGAYTEAPRCDGCGEYITDTYVEIGDERYCEDCFIIRKLGE